MTPPKKRWVKNAIKKKNRILRLHFSYEKNIFKNAFHIAFFSHFFWDKLVYLALHVQRQQ